MFFVLYALGLVNVILSRCSKLIAYITVHENPLTFA